MQAAEVRAFPRALGGSSGIGAAVALSLPAMQVQIVTRAATLEPSDFLRPMKPTG